MPSSCSNSWRFWCGAQHQIVNTDTCTALLNFKVMRWQKPEGCFDCDTRTGMESNSLLVTFLLGFRESTWVSYSTLTWGSNYARNRYQQLCFVTVMHRKSWPKCSLIKKETQLHMSICQWKLSGVGVNTKEMPGNYQRVASVIFHIKVMALSAFYTSVRFLFSL